MMTSLATVGLFSVVFSLILFKRGVENQNIQLLFAIIVYWGIVCLINSVVLLFTVYHLYVTFKRTFDVFRREDKQILLFVFIFVVIYFV